MLSESERAMLLKRRRALKPLPTLRWVLPLVWVAMLVTTAIRYPLLVNPWRVQTLVEDRTLGREDLASLATMAPMLVLLIQVLVIAFIVGALAVFHREKKLIDLLMTQEEHAQDGEGIR